VQALHSYQQTLQQTVTAEERRPWFRAITHQPGVV